MSSSAPRVRRDGVFRAGETMRCLRCRGWVRYGEEFVVYSEPDGSGGEKTWWACVPCAGIYADVARKNTG